MLTEEQVAELLSRCEVSSGRRLEQVRGNLRTPSNRADAVWELLVVEAFSAIGTVRHEPPGGGPDIQIELPSGTLLSVEVAYLRPRSAESDRVSSLVVDWVQKLCERKGVPAHRVRCEFYGDSQHPSGPVRTLPKEHEKKKFLDQPEVWEFFDRITEDSLRPVHARLPLHTIALHYNPIAATSPFPTVGYGGSLVESPKAIEEHGAYRTVMRKLEQHTIAGPHIVCIGSDISHAMSSSFGGWGVTLDQALAEAANRSSGRLTAVLTAHIRSELPFSPRTADVRYHRNPAANFKLEDRDWAFLLRLNLNRWRYTYPISPVKSERYRTANTGPLGYSENRNGSMRISIPAHLVVDALAGSGNFWENYSPSVGLSGPEIAERLQEGWRMVSCRFEKGDVPSGTASVVHFQFEPPYENVFSPAKNN